MVLQKFSNIHLMRTALAEEIIETTIARIDARPVGLRNHGPDDAMFSPANDGIILAVSHRDPAMARQIFSACYAHALQYEADNHCQIHKGSITFNIGIAHLREYDFTAAMHYFELAQEETRLSTGEKNWSIYLNPQLFDPHFWDALDAAEAQYPLKIHAKLWGKTYSKDVGKKTWRKLSGHSKLLYIISAARRVHLRQLATRSGWQDSDSVRVGYWNLIADLARLLETEIFRRAKVNPKPWQLKSLLKQGFKATRRGDLSTFVGGYMAAREVHSTKSFNTHYPAIRKDIEDDNFPKLERIAHAAHFLHAVRNQVQHHVDRRLVLYKNLEEAVFTADLLLALCRLGSWAN